MKDFNTIDAIRKLITDIEANEVKNIGIDKLIPHVGTIHVLCESKEISKTIKDIIALAFLVITDKMAENEATQCPEYRQRMYN